MILETDPQRLTIKNAMRGLSDEQRICIANAMRMNFNMFRSGHCTITQMEGFCFHLVFGDDKVTMYKYMGVRNEVEGTATVIAEAN